jgi:hypothetical protein
MLGDVISANRKILQDVQYHVRRMDYDREVHKDDANYDEVAFTEEISESETEEASKHTAELEPEFTPEFVAERARNIDGVFDYIKNLNNAELDKRK